MSIYLDNAATTAVLPEASAVACDTMTNLYANPASLHTFGFEAEKLLEKILFRLPIVKDKNTVDTTAPYRIYDTLDIEVHTQHELSQNKQQRPYHEKGL